MNCDNCKNLKDCRYSGIGRFESSCRFFIKVDDNVKHPISEANQASLLPCPFCGPRNSIVECYEDDYGKWRVACGACGVHTGIRPDNNREMVINHWNTRIKYNKFL